MDAPTLSKREELILQAVVQSYITSAEPAGSRSLVKRFKLDISPATVRNVMADLEELGYLQQVHTSSGRVPTDRGYRYYVDHLMRIQQVTQAERSRIEEEFSRKLADADEILRQTSRLLAVVTHQAGIVEAPRASDATVHRIEILPIGNSRVVVMAVDNYGTVRTRIAAVEREMTAEDAGRLNRFVNGAVRGVLFDDLQATLQQALQKLVDDQRRLAEQAAEVLDAAAGDRPGLLFLDGTTQLFEQPEFRNVEKAREVFGLLQEQDRVLELLRSGLAGPRTTASRVVIGSEACGTGHDEIAVVAAPYRIRDKDVGMVGILGPRRMPYSKLTGVVEFTAGMLSRFLTRLAG